MTKAQTKQRKSLPIFAKCLIILFGTCAILVSTQTYLGNLTREHVAETAVVTLGASITTISASEIAGPVRFGDADALKERISTILESTLVAEAAVVLGKDGNVLVSMPEDIPPHETEALLGVAGQARDSGGRISAESGLLVGEPIRFGKDNAVVGTLAIHWSPDYLLATVEAEQKMSLIIDLVLLGVMSIAAMLAFRKIISLPLSQITDRTMGLANQDYNSPIPFISRGDEIGKSAVALDSLRLQLAEAEEAKLDTFFKGAGFQSSSAAMILCDENLCISHVNKSFITLANDNLGDFQGHVPGFDPESLKGKTADVFHKSSNASREMLQTASFPIETDIRMGELLLGLVINKIVDDSGNTAGFVLEWSEVTERRKRTAILQSLEQAQLRADFSASGRLVTVNDKMASALSLGAGEVPEINLDSFVHFADNPAFMGDLQRGKAVFGKLDTTLNDSKLTLDGSISPTHDRSGQTLGYVLLGNDITEAERKLREANEENERMTAAQTTVVQSLQSALTSLSEGDLKVRIDTEFTGEYAALQRDFNSALTELDSAIGQILMSADSILNETGNVSGAADDLSRRTEQQAATLEQTAAAISQLTASVASAASGAKQANDVVVEARDNAAASGEVVQQAVDAMGEISNSSDQISRIIGVIDEIAFQTNLLALNAGVEAARAGEAGRGFAVVASEVRALAQRSSEAASEITDLISTSGEHVKKGVSLVDKAGHALTEIVESVGGIAEHVSGIAASAKEQSTGLDEINAAMNQLDQVTQKNVAMFEETTAASQTMNSEATSLVAITKKFDCSTAQGNATVAANDSRKHRSETKEANKSFGDDIAVEDAEPKAPPKTKAQAAPPPKTPKVTGNLALAVEDPIEDDWEEF